MSQQESSSSAATNVTATTKAPAPDEAMRVAVDDTFVAAVEDRLGMGHGAWDMISGEKICRAVIEQAAAMIHQAGSERERELEDALRQMLSYVERRGDAAKFLAVGKASRLLGGESK